MLSAKHRKFAQGLVVGMTAAEAYGAAYPKAAPDSARKNAARLAGQAEVKAEVARMRAKADELAGSAVLTLMEKRIFLARIVRANLAELDTGKDGDLLTGYEDSPKTGIKLRIADKLEAIRLDSDLAGEGSEAQADDAISDLIRELRK